MSRTINNKIRPIQNTIILVCGGKTEEWYFNNFKKNDSNVHIYCDCDTGRSSPMKLIQRAISLKKQYGESCLKVFAIFDKDDFPDFDYAIKYASKNNITPIFSNQAFELWFLQHFECNRNPIGRKQYLKKLNGYLNKHECIFTYDKKKKNIDNMYSQLKDLLPEAINNSKRSFQEKKLIHKKTGKNYSNLESVSNVHDLVEYLMKL